MAYRRVDLTKYVVISIWFGCNNNCSICMLSRLKRRLPPIGFDGFKKAVIRIMSNRRYENLSLSGAEVTTFDALGAYIQFAASLRWFKTIQIQTNGRRLADKEYFKYLVDCGANEFFISIHGLDDVHDAITRRPGSFEQTMTGLRNAQAFDVNVISNTVLTRANFRDVPRLMSILSKEAVSEIHLWNFFPMENTDSKDLLVGMTDFVQLLPEILSVIKPTGKALVLKGFPECLAMGAPGFFDSGFSVTLLPDMFWQEFAECGFGTCIHRDTCKASQCWGLSAAYIQKYGYERDLLSPAI